MTRTTLYLVGERFSPRCHATGLDWPRKVQSSTDRGARQGSLVTLPERPLASLETRNPPVEPGAICACFVVSAMTSRPQSKESRYITPSFPIVLPFLHELDLSR